MAGKVKLQTMTGEEFLKFMEGIDKDGVIDTIREMLNSFRGLSEDETFKEYIDRKVEDATISDEDRAMINKLIADIESGEYGLTPEDREAIHEVKERMDDFDIAEHTDIDEIFPNQNEER